METIQHVLKMKGGSGAESYARNSLVQSGQIRKTIPVMQLSLLDFCNSNSPDTVVVADLGCSSGPNVWTAVSSIVSYIHESYRRLARPSPCFQVFLNDLPGNDFNNVFNSLPEFLMRMQQVNGPEFGPCFIAGAPGTFHERLFPDKSLHFVHSSASLHWLSQVPPELARSKSPVMNKGRIYISKTSSLEVVNAYTNQFRRDFSKFLKLRSEEMTAGGHMFLRFMGRRLADPYDDESCLLWDYMSISLQHLVKEGLVEEERLDAYNTPYYEPYIEDVREEIEKEGSFSIHRLDTVVERWDTVNGGQKCCGRETTAENMAKAIRAVNESMLQSHFGSHVVDRLFQRFVEIMVSDTREVESVSLIVSLVRN